VVGGVRRTSDLTSLEWLLGAFESFSPRIGGRGAVRRLCLIATHHADFSLGLCYSFR
jgi:hypothetical protein